VRPCARSPWLVPALVAIAIAACAPAPVAPPPPPADPDAFSPERAWVHLQALAAIGPRVVGSRAAGRARRYIASELEHLGAAVTERSLQVEAGGGSQRLRHVSGRLSGASTDAILLAAHYDTHPTDDFRFVGANDGGSGVALLLETARVLSRRERHYTYELVFVDGDALASGPDEAPPGSRSLVRDLKERGELDHVRLAVYFNQVADPDLALARDLRSDRSYREVFWDAAAALGRSAAFRRESAYESPATGHLAFRELGFRRVVAIVDNRFGGDEAPGLYWHTEDDTLEHCSPASLQAVGEVTLEALGRIERRLDKIDRFAAAPLHEPAEELGPLPTPGRDAAPEPAPAAAPGEAGPARP